MELVGPIQSIKLPTLEASHFRGFAINSSSTLSQGMAVQGRSQIRFRKIRWMLIMGKKGSKAEAASTENILLPIKAMFVYSVTLSFWEFT